MKKILYFLIVLSVGGVCAQNWQVVDNGLSGAVRSILPDSSDRLVLGGEFHYVNGVLQKSISVWNDTSILPMGEFTCNPVFTLARWHSEVYATDCTGMYSYQNGDWTAVGQGFDGTALCYLPTDSFLFVGGGYNSINGQPSSGLASWNGSVWQDIPLPYFGMVSDMAVFRNTLYVVGQFADSTGNMISRVLRRGCSCAGWVDVTPYLGSVSAWLSVMTVYHDRLYVAGSFSKADGSVGNSIAKYDGSSWGDVSGGIAQSGSYGKVFALHVFDSVLYVGGYFQNVGDSSVITPGGQSGYISASNIASWNGTSWGTLGGNFDQSIMTIADWNQKIYVGGRFTEIDNIPIKFIAKYLGP